MSDNEYDKDNILSEFDKIKTNHTIDVNQYMVNAEEDLPDFGSGNIDILKDKMIDYEVEAKEIIENLADIYLGDNKELMEHPYIIGKIEEDSKYYASLKFLKEISETLLLKQITQVESGETNAVMYKAINETIREVRDNIKDGRIARTEIEKMYRDMRKDFGLNETSAKAAEGAATSDETSDEVIVDAKKLNDAIADFLSKK